MTEQPPKKTLKDIINDNIAFLDLGTTDDIVRDIKRGINDLIGLVIKKPAAPGQQKKQPVQQHTVQAQPVSEQPAEPVPHAAPRPAALPETKMTVHTFVDPGEKPAAAQVTPPVAIEPVAIQQPEPAVPHHAPVSVPVQEPVTPPAAPVIPEPAKEEIPTAQAAVKQHHVDVQPVPVMPEQHIMPPPLTETYEKPKQLLDNKMVKSLHHSLGEDTFKELYTELWEKADSILAMLNKALAEKNMKTINERGHEMKGMCANFGLCGISSVCRDIEESGMREDYSTAALLIPHLPELLKNSRQHIQDFLDGKLIISNLDEQEDDDKSGYLI